MHKVVIDYAKCAHCGTCIGVCPMGVYEDKGEQVAAVKVKECIACMSCVPACPTNAINVEEDPEYFST